MRPARRLGVILVVAALLFHGAFAATCGPQSSYCDDNGYCRTGVYVTVYNADDDEYFCEQCKHQIWKEDADTGSGECCGDDGLDDDWCGKYGYCFDGVWKDVYGEDDSPFHCQSCNGGTWHESGYCCGDTPDESWCRDDGYCFEGQWMTVTDPNTNEHYCTNCVDIDQDGVADGAWKIDLDSGQPTCCGDEILENWPGQGGVCNLGEWLSGDCIDVNDCIDEPWLTCTSNQKECTNHHCRYNKDCSFCSDADWCTFCAADDPDLTERSCTCAGYVWHDITCCGDDSGEHYFEDKRLCCQDPDSCTSGNECYTEGTMKLFFITKVCVGGVWVKVDVLPGSFYSGALSVSLPVWIVGTSARCTTDDTAPCRGISGSHNVVLGEDDEDIYMRIENWDFTTALDLSTLEFTYDPEGYSVYFRNGLSVPVSFRMKRRDGGVLERWDVSTSSWRALADHDGLEVTEREDGSYIIRDTKSTTASIRDPEGTCGDDVCDVNLGDCDNGCAECNVASCAADIDCNLEVGERCDNAPSQCTCPDGYSCDPEQLVSDERGCYTASCGNGVCDPGECNLPCPDCDRRECVDDFCSVYLEENCTIAPECGCDDSALCDTGDARSDAKGCFIPKCEDSVCDLVHIDLAKNVTVDLLPLRECDRACLGCDLVTCANDTRCNIGIGENCTNSKIHCACPIDQVCDPLNALADEKGCYSKGCGDGTCDPGECDIACVDCNTTVCALDLKCNTAFNETCASLPTQCPCLEGWKCNIAHPLADERGCHDPKCGDGQCDPGECASNCADCSLAVCTGDLLCTFTGEDCKSSPLDCQCDAAKICAPDDPRSDEMGCYSTSCGDTLCEGSEDCSSCTKDCGECLSLLTPVVDASVPPGKTARAAVSVFNQAKDALTISLSHDAPAELTYPRMLRVEAGQTRAIDVHVKLDENARGAFNGTLTITAGEESHTAIIQVTVKGTTTVYLGQEQFSLTASPGGKANFTLQVVNAAPELRRVELTIGGSIGPWLSLAETSLTIPTETSKDVMVTVDVPSGTETGSLSGTITSTSGEEESVAKLSLFVLERKASCGDGTCQQEEDCKECPKDCECDNRLRLSLPAGKIIIAAGIPQSINVEVRNTGEGNLTDVVLEVTIKKGSVNVTPSKVDIPNADGAMFNLTLMVSEEGSYDLLVKATCTEGARNAKRLAIEVSPAPPEVIEPKDDLEDDLEQSELKLREAEDRMTALVEKGTEEEALAELEKLVTEARTNVEMAQELASDGKREEAARLVAEAESSLETYRSKARKLERGSDVEDVPSSGSRISGVFKALLGLLILGIGAFAISLRKKPPASPPQQVYAGYQAAPMMQQGGYYGGRYM
ncbi:MAG: hypothetical protein QGG26_16300 [Candidatus Undinarchaeales archaeon]|jgi:hypothetical protein|nr:hypothetical protein [Candidatus Undinarchaeales archaeon]